MQIPRPICLSLALSALLVTLTRAQTAVPPKSNEHRFADEPYVVEQLRTIVRFEADGKSQRETIVRIRVQSESAVREFGLLVYPFMSSFESFDVVYTRVRKPDGTVVETPTSEIQELDSAVSRQAPMYTDQREKHIAVKSLAVGDVLEVDLRWTGHDAIAPGHFWYDHDFVLQGICLDEQFELNVPRDTPVKLTSLNPPPKIKEDGTRRIYSFHSSHLEKPQDLSEDQKIPAWEKDFYGIEPPALRISSFTSWSDVGAWYAGLQQSRVQVTSQIRSVAEEITKGKTTDDQKIRAIYDYVAGRIRYIGIDLGAGRYTPHAADEVLANRYGDCKDKHTLFAALLEAVGLHAYPVLISSKFKLDASLPSASLFDHVISAVPQGDSFLFLDTTPEVAPYGMLLSALRDREALVMPASAPARLVTTPANPPSLNIEKFKMDASIDSQGTLDGKTHFEERGDPEILLRLAYRDTPQNQWKELTQAISGRMGFGGTVSQVAAAQPEKTADPFWITYDYHRADYSDWKDNRITLPFPPMFLPELNEAQKKSKDALPLGSPNEFYYQASLKMPPGIQPVPPPNVEQKTEFADYTATYRFENGTLYGARRLTLKVRAVPGTERAAYSTFVKGMQEDMQRWIFLTSNFDQDNPVVKGLALIRQGKTSEAVTLLEKAAAQDSSNQQLAFALGSAYLHVPDEAKAAEQFDKLLASNPGPGLLNDVAYEYANSNLRLSEAVEYASRAVAEVSRKTMNFKLDLATSDNFLSMTFVSAVWDTLGWAKFRAGDTASAEKYIQSAWTLNPSALVGEHLVEVYEKLGKKREADHTCRLALAAPGLTAEPGTKEKLLAAQKRIGISKPESGTVDARPFRPPALAELSDMRTFRLPRKAEFPANSKIASKLALFTIAIENGRSTAQAHFVSGDRELLPEAQALATVDYRQTFPDSSPARILRAGWVSCSKYMADCSFVLFLVSDKPSLDMVNAKPVDANP